MQILLVEDDAALVDALKKALVTEGFAVNCLSRGQQAITSVKTELPDLVILDLGLPDMDGLDVMRSMRATSADLPILILTARSSINDKVAGLDLGADDYLVKPFDVGELLARIRVIERRASSLKHSGLTITDVMLDTISHEVSVAGQVISMSRRECVLTKESLESKLYSWGEEISSNAIEVHIHHIRKKLPSGFIQTIRGVGYIIKLP